MLPDPRTVDLSLHPEFTHEEGKYIYKQGDRSFQFNEILKEWVSPELTQGQLQYRELKKRKLEELKQKREQQRIERVNTGVYISNLPIDIDSVALEDLVKKYGVISMDLLTNKPRIKMYTDDKVFKGDALVIYYKPESVELCIQMMDGLILKPGTEPIRVEKAQFHKAEKKEKKELSELERKTLKRRKKLMDEMNGWNDEINPKWIRTMVLKRVFTLEELQEEPECGQDIIEDIQEECAKHGLVESVILFDKESDGIVMVKFAEVKSCDECIEVMNGRFFGGRQLVAARYNGEYYERSKEEDRKRVNQEGDHQEKERFKEEEDVNDNGRLQDFIKHVGEDK
jgi:HIV Tat-specific factor 1